MPAIIKGSASFVILFLSVSAFATHLVPAAISTQVNYEKVKELESDFALQLKSASDEGLTTEGFYENIVQAAELDPTGNFDESYLNRWEDKNSEVHHLHYTLLSKKQHFLMLMTHLTLQNYTEKLLEREITLKAKNNIQKKFQTLHDLFMKWSLASDTIKEGVNPKDQRDRMYSFTDYFRGLRVFLTEFGRMPEVAAPFSSNAGQKAVGIGKLALSGTNLVLQVLGRNLVGLVDLVNPTRCLSQEAQDKISRKLWKNFTPFTTRGGVATLFRGLAEIKGYQVTVNGRENLEHIPLNGIPGRKVVNLFLPSHRSDTVDAILMAHLELPHFLLFANPAAFAGNVVFGQLLASLPEFISVGKWRGIPNLTPTEKLLRALETGRSPNVINYPQGFVSNAGEILPINANFVKTLLKTLIDNGFEVNVIPVSYEVATRFVSTTGEVDEAQISAHFHRPLLSPLVRRLVSLQVEGEEQVAKGLKQGGPPRYFDHFLSTLWLENIERNKELQIDTMMDRIEKNLQLRFIEDWVNRHPAQ